MNIEQNLEDMRKTAPFGEKWDFDAVARAKKTEAEKVAKQYNDLKNTELGSSGADKKLAYQNLNRW